MPAHLVLSQLADSVATWLTARCRGFIFHNHLAFSDQISDVPINLAIIIFVNFAASVLSPGAPAGF